MSRQVGEARETGGPEKCSKATGREPCDRRAALEARAGPAAHDAIEISDDTDGEADDSAAVEAGGSREKEKLRDADEVSVVGGDRKPKADESCGESVSVDDNEYEVEAVLRHRVKRSGRVEYLLKWTGYVNPTWEDQAHLDCQELVDIYWRKQQKERDRSSSSTGAPANEAETSLKTKERKGADPQRKQTRAKQDAPPVGDPWRKQAGKKRRAPPFEDWEAKAVKVAGVEQECDTGELKVEIEWTTGHTTVHTNWDVREHIPRLLADFYTDRVRFIDEV